MSNNSYAIDEKIWDFLLFFMDFIYLQILSDEKTLSLGNQHNGAKLLLHMLVCRSQSTDVD